MAITIDYLNAFHQFAAARLSGRGAESLHELVEIWELEHAAPEFRAQNVAAIQAAVRDMQNGDTGRPAKLVIEEMRSELAGRPQ